MTSSNTNYDYLVLQAQELPYLNQLTRLDVYIRHG